MPTSGPVRRVVAAILVAVSALVPAAAAAAGDGVATDAEASAAITSFESAFESATSTDRRRLVADMATVRHPKITDRLHRVAEDEKADPGSRVAAFDLLAERGRSEKPVTARVARWLTKESEAAQKAFVKRDFGVPMEPRTGEPRKGREADDAVKRGQDRAQVTSAAIRCAVAVGWHPKEAAEAMRPFVQSPHDDLAIAAVGALGSWKDRESLADLLQLYRMYPRENRWETGAVVHAGGTNASAQGEWMKWFGHPLKQRARPTVVRALQTALDSICGRRFDSPEALETWIREDGGRRPSGGSKR